MDVNLQHFRAPLELLAQGAERRDERRRDPCAVLVDLGRQHLCRADIFHTPIRRKILIDRDKTQHFAIQIHGHPAARLQVFLQRQRQGRLAGTRLACEPVNHNSIMLKIV
jgi:hypothetical protein